jgi:hypothetical protein
MYEGLEYEYGRAATEWAGEKKASRRVKEYIEGFEDKERIF